MLGWITGSGTPTDMYDLRIERGMTAFEFYDAENLISHCRPWKVSYRGRPRDTSSSIRFTGPQIGFPRDTSDYGARSKERSY